MTNRELFFTVQAAVVHIHVCIVTPRHVHCLFNDKYSQNERRTKHACVRNSVASFRRLGAFALDNKSTQRHRISLISPSPLIQLTMIEAKIMIQIP